jgi:hypothetical protein
MDVLEVEDGGILADCPASSWKLARVADDAPNRPGRVLAATTYSLKTAEPPDVE